MIFGVKIEILNFSAKMKIVSSTYVIFAVKLKWIWRHFKAILLIFAPKQGPTAVLQKSDIFITNQKNQSFFQTKIDTTYSYAYVFILQIDWAGTQSKSFGSDHQRIFILFIYGKIRRRLGQNNARRACLWKPQNWIFW